MQLKKKGIAAAGLFAAAALGYSYVPTIAGKVRYFSMKCENEKNIYLTFDDGPDNRYTERLLDLLAQYEIKAAFFVVGEAAMSNPEIVRRMQEEGHLVGLHSWNHKSAMLQTPAGTRKDFEKGVGALNSLGVNVKYYRPPWGHVNLTTGKHAEKYSLKKTLWNVMAEDWKKNTTADEIQYKLLMRAEPGDIICLHDGRVSEEAAKAMIKALEMTIPIWLEDGYRFKRVDEKVKYEVQCK